MTRRLTFVAASLLAITFAASARSSVLRAEQGRPSAGVAISGRVTNERGDPMVGIEMHALKRTRLDGATRVAEGAATTTDDLGRYRLIGLTEGEYTVLARPDPDPETPLLATLLFSTPAAAADVISGMLGAGHELPLVDATVRHYPITFFGKSTTIERAKFIALSAGAEKRNVDLRLKPVSTVRVGGTLNGVADRNRPIMIRLLPGTSDRDVVGVDAAATMCDDEGRFEFAHAAPGKYMLVAQADPLPNAPANQRTRVTIAQTPIVVSSRDIDNVVLSAAAAGPGSDTHSPVVRASSPSAPMNRVTWAEIRGQVTSDPARKKPVRDALVMIAGVDAGTIHVTTTDSHGRYVLGSLPPGHFLLAAGKAGLISVMYGADRPGRPGDPIALSAGAHRDDVALTLLPGSAIAGRVTDDRGQPVVGARVRAMQRRTVGGDVAVTGDLGDPQAATTNDRGEYRIFDLPPGDYAIGVQQKNAPGGDGRPPAAWTATYYPNAVDPSKAATIALAAGDVRANVDVTTRLAPLQRIDGVLTGTANANVQITLRPRTERAIGAPLTNFNTRPGPEGRFTFPGLTPGEYTVFARTLPGPPPPSQPPARSPVRWASSDVVVEPDRPTYVSLALQPPLSIAGRVVFEGLVKRPAGLAIRIGVRPLPGAIIPDVPEPVLLDDQGRFRLANLAPGKYTLFAVVPFSDNVTQIPDWIARSAITGGSNALDAPFQLSRDVDDVIVTLVDEPQELIGIVRDASGHAKRDVTIVTFPVDRKGWFPQSRRIVLRQSDSDGQVVFGMAAALPPGDYYVAAVSDLAQGEQFDSILLDSLIPSAARVTLGIAESKRIEIRVGGGL